MSSEQREPDRAGFKPSDRLRLLLRRINPRLALKTRPEKVLRLVAEVRREFAAYEHRVVRTAHDEFGLSWRQIAEAMDEPVMNVHRRYHRPEDER